MNTSETGVSSAVHELVTRWVRAQTLVAQRQAMLNEAKGELALATFGLGDHLSPDDAKAGEVFNIWYLDGLLEVYHTTDEEQNRQYLIKWRKEPSPKSYSKIS